MQKVIAVANLILGLGSAFTGLVVMVASIASRFAKPELEDDKIAYRS